MLYQINNEKWIYETRTKEFDRIETEFTIDKKETDDEETEITIYSVCFVRTDRPQNEKESVKTYRIEVFMFVNEETISSLTKEIKWRLSRRQWEDIFNKPLP